MIPRVCLCVADLDLMTDLHHVIHEVGGSMIMLNHNNLQRYKRMHTIKDRIACVIDDDPEMVMAATALGMDAIIYDMPENRYFSWHLRATSIDDARQGLSYIIKKWKGQHE